MISLVALIGFVVAGCFGLGRLVVGPGVADRVVALDVVLMSLMGAIAVDAARREETTNLMLLVVIAIIGFTATVAASRFVEAEDPSNEKEFIR